MDYGEFEFDLNTSKDRPLKRFRPVKDGDDGLRPYTPNSASPGLQPEADQEAGGSGEQQTKKGGRKRPLSCGECRRLKLKCDRVFPCNSCRKRGCAEICPDGALTGGKGSRFILANTEQLHEKIKVMSDRIRDLELGLQTVQSKVSPKQHPLLRQDLLAIKKSPDLFGLEQQASRHDSTQAGPSKASTSTSAPPRDRSAPSDEQPSRPGVTSGGEGFIPQDISQLSHAFPSPWTISPEADLVTRQRIRDHLPSREEAQRICEQVRENAFWQFLPDSSESFLPNLIYSVYNSPLPALMPHRLGLFLMILALGSCVDLSGGDESKQMGEQYYRLSRAALCELPLLEDTSMDAIQALFFMQWFLLAFSEDKKAFEYAWSVSGLTIKLAQTMMLHRDGVRSKIIPEEQDKRRSLFWNLVRFDTRLSLLLRRPPGINMRHVDVKRPTSEDDDPIITEYVWWQNEFLVQCSIPVVDVTLSVQPPSYTDVLKLDREIRNFDVPLSLQIVDDIDHRPPPRPLGMQQAMVSTVRLSTLLHLHRSYFTVALTSNENFTVQHTYAPSVLAVYSGCCSLISTIATIYQWEPELSIRYAMYWNNLFSAACALCFLVSRAPTLPIAPTALQELDKVAHLFTEVRYRCPKVASFYHVANKLILRAREHYFAWRNGSPLPRDEMTDEISVLVRKILPTTTSTPVAPTVAITDPFQHAHSYLRRCLEHATALDPCDATGFHLTRIRGYIGNSVTHPQSNVRSDVRSGKAPEGESSSGWASRGGGSMNGGSSSSAGFGTAEIADSSWMSWL